MNWSCWILYLATQLLEIVITKKWSEMYWLTSSLLTTPPDIIITQLPAFSPQTYWEEPGVISVQPWDASQMHIFENKVCVCVCLKPHWRRAYPLHLLQTNPWLTNASMQWVIFMETEFAFFTCILWVYYFSVLFVCSAFNKNKNPFQEMLSWHVCFNVFCEPGSLT